MVWDFVKQILIFKRVTLRLCIVNSVQIWSSLNQNKISFAYNCHLAQRPRNLILIQNLFSFSPLDCNWNLWSLSQVAVNIPIYINQSLSIKTGKAIHLILTIFVGCRNVYITQIYINTLSDNSYMIRNELNIHFNVLVLHFYLSKGYRFESLCF